MNELVAWLRAQLDDDERVARDAIREWGDVDRYRWEGYRLSSRLEDAGWYPPPEGFDGWWQRFAPARVLAGSSGWPAGCDAGEARDLRHGGLTT